MPSQTPECSTRNNHTTRRGSHDQRRPSPTLPEVDIHHYIDEEEAVLVRANGDAVNVQPVPVPPVQLMVPLHLGLLVLLLADLFSLPGREPENTTLGITDPSVVIGLPVCRTHLGP